MQHPNSLELTRTALVIVDLQEAFRTKIRDFEEITERVRILVEAAKLLGVLIIVTEQYPKGLGHTATVISEALPQGQSVIEKTTFSSCGATAFYEQLNRKQIGQVLVCGIEAHICVNQTVHDLLANGYQVHLIVDCISSRNKTDRKAGFAKMQASGAISSSVELALFELMRDAKHEQFKAIQRLIK